MIIRLNVKDAVQAEQIVELQKASYKVEAEIIGFDGIPPLKDTVDSIKECEEIFYGYYIENSLAGIISYKIEDVVLDIHRVAVHPLFFRKGIARKLLQFVETNNNVKSIIVSTGMLNEPAVCLYKSMGFLEVESREVVKGLYITSFQKSKG